MVKDNTRRVPIVPVRGSVVFPHTDTLLSFGRTKSVAAVSSAFQEDKVIAVFSQKDSRTADPGQDDLNSIGTIATITQMMTTEGEIHALIRGQARVNLKEIIAQEPYLIGKVEEIPEEIDESPEIGVLAKKLQELFKKSINLGKQAEIMTVMKLVSGTAEPVEMSDQVASLLEIKPSEKQKILEEINVRKRLLIVLEYLAKEVNALEIERTISSKTQKRFEDQMKKAMLREKKKTIEEELGEMDEEGEISGEEFKEYKTKIKEAGMPPDVKTRAEKELKRLSEMSPNNPEGGYIRNYLDWLCDMPWSHITPNNVPMKKASKILEKDHYGIEKAKERIMEFLAVMKLKKEKKHPKKDGTGAHPTILCFIGPPGVGKTSIGKSIAKALNRKFVRISLGGIRDEAEIRGHRRTYVGAMPGRIIQGMKNAGTKNPVFMLDEIDKIGVDFRGDPSSALLEALDPEQNREFSDHYLEVPFDLSEVMFICTGNMLDTIPAPLRDRMEVITFPGYTETEKFHIARKFLWPKQLEVQGLESKKIEITDAGLKEVIGSYTREAGVRNLERNLANVCRKVARLVAEKKKFPKKVEVSDVRKFLGSQRFSSQIAEKKDEIGMSTGLSVTPFGGEILFIEVSLMPGKGKLTLTGQLGDIMRESAKAAFTWTRSHYNELGLKSNFAENIDVHIHVPEGSVPKDGPSAGVAITVALVSALTGIPVRRDVGMTGEVTLRGRVLEIGGLKEKSIAGHRAGLKTIIVPKDNKKDIDDIPAQVKKDIKFVFAENVEDVLKVALKKWLPASNFRGKFTSIPTLLVAN
ncbi:MAG: ATP-dependent protease La, ATP-dependent Lon protease [Microgenomates group bacterium GW2011_GWC1_43_13]|uniref:Lon protease n=2 Tax=Candidatus Woeseibacteriota TaxID=1752722 RepID=A0A1F8DI49_9BACT|nr:MAG: ATP-dependent protease La, ATP-dependent Lon protease [Microgenomates group bacterium GW2011_GWC1_43_13]KKT32988.1 MAG: Lon protease [Candidatus Woesebacteria bacterium GW2011_GWB1_44_11]OGM75921.1 MAG: endopeptidase La [Candidatus Woesebacteria bacterium RIFOXYA1_FULL_43_16]OGM81452.1 MAG: endopeptidase La [Candidatus Woesebacteria bacterium RIFOXYB1_FULL_42_36]OGM84025.1 MAG: endopeptidase La [Candidatus Woesebacteria bacterium RIFOXYC1_FULL_43_18]OGM88283.1 MAG: endopeptidase La [Ca